MVYIRLEAELSSIGFANEVNVNKKASIDAVLTADIDLAGLSVDSDWRF